MFAFGFNSFISLYLFMCIYLCVATVEVYVPTTAQGINDGNTKPRRSARLAAKEAVKKLKQQSEHDATIPGGDTDSDIELVTDRNKQKKKTTKNKKKTKKQTTIAIQHGVARLSKTKGLSSGKLCFIVDCLFLFVV